MSLLLNLDRLLTALFGRSVDKAQENTEKKFVKGVVALLLWAVGGLIMIWWAFWSELVPFSERLYGVDATPYLNALYAELEPKLEVYSGDIVAVTLFTEGCACNDKLDVELKRIESLGVATQTLALNKLPASDQLKELIPSTPALVVISKSFATASYMGPHTDSGRCGTGNSVLPLITSNLDHGFNPDYLNVGSLGCYCSH